MHLTWMAIAMEICIMRRSANRKRLSSRYEHASVVNAKHESKLYDTCTYVRVCIYANAHGQHTSKQLNVHICTLTYSFISELRWLLFFTFFLIWGGMKIIFYSNQFDCESFVVILQKIFVYCATVRIRKIFIKFYQKLIFIIIFLKCMRKIIEIINY